MSKLQKTVNKVLSLILTAAMCVSLVPVGNVTALAAAAEKYTVTLADCGNGSLSFDGYAGKTHRFSEGEEVTVKIEPEEGYDFLSLTLSQGDGTVVATDYTADLSAYTFVMTGTDISVKAEFCDEADLDHSIQTLGGSVTRTSKTGSKFVGSKEMSMTEDEFYTLFNMFMKDSKVTGTSYNIYSRWDCSGMINYFVGAYLEPYFNGTDLSDLPDTANYTNNYYSYTTVQQFANWGTVVYNSKTIKNISNTDPGKLQPGDLIFYGNNFSSSGETMSGDITHVAMYVGEGSTLAEVRNNSNYVSGGYYQVENSSTANSAFLPVDGMYSDPYGVRVDRFHLHQSGNTGFSLTQPYSTATSADVVAVIRIMGIVDSGYLTLEKSSGNTDITGGNDCYSLKGAQYTVYTDSTCTKVAEDANGDDAVLTTKSDGTTNTLEMEPGTYYVKETKAAKGYALDTTGGNGKGVYTVEITADNTEDVPYTLKVTDAPQSDPVGVLLEKLDSDTGEAVAQGDGSLAGAEFTVKYYDGYYTTASQVSGLTAERTWVLKTDEDGCIMWRSDYLVSGDKDLYYNEAGDSVLPLGTVTIQETKEPTGYLLNDETFVIQITGDGTAETVFTYNEPKVPEPVIRGGVEVQKRDVESLRDDPQGSGSFDGITLEITNTSDAAVMVDSDGDGVLEKFEPGEVVLTLVTDENGYAATASDALPYGSYTITETAVPGDEGHRVVVGKETDDGYLMGSDDSAAYTANLSIDFTIREEGVIVDLTGGEDSVVNADSAITDQVKRGDIALVKKDADTQEGMSVPFKVTSLTTGESHVFWTDPNGSYSSDSTWNKHSYKTDAGEDYSDGLWFYGYSDWESFVTYGDDGYMTDNGYVDDGVGALPYDNYRIDELRCDANEGKELVHETFTVYDDIRVIDFDTVYNYDSAYIHTSAWASDTGTQLCYVGGDDGDGWVTLYDDVHYYNLEPGQTYGIYGVALDADTREPEYDHYGNEICAWTTFTASDSGNGMEIQEFHFDVEDLSGHRVVFFETIFAVDKDGNILYDYSEDNEYYPYAFYVAEDPDDYENQTIYFPQVGTELLDDETGEHFTVTDGTVTLVDTVAVTEVPEGETVEIVGTLHDRATGGALVDEDGNEITASGTFISPGLDTWYAEIVFTFDASALTANGAVAFEDMYLVTEQDTGSDDDDDGGHGPLIGRHADLDDEDQTAYFPKIYTTMVDSETESHISFADGTATLIDTVVYENLIEGWTYTMSGVLMDKDTGLPITDDDGNEVTAEVTFVAGEDAVIADAEAEEEDADTDDADVEGEDTEEADSADDVESTELILVSGSVEMVFTFPAESISGKAAVAFEYLTLTGTDDGTETGHEDDLVTEHTDLSDEDQTVWFPYIRTHAYGGSTGMHLENAAEGMTIVDAVEYHGLIPGETYVMTGTLHDRETGEALDADGATVSVEFVPEETDGWVYLTFTIDGTDLAGHTVVAFEECTLNGVPVATHEDLTDEEQAVYIPYIATHATSDDTDSQTVYRSGKAHITDEVTYENLIPGYTYTLTGILMDKETGNAVAVDGEIISSTVTFKAKKADGSEKVKFTFSAEGMPDAGVCFEYLYVTDDGGGDGVQSLVASHEDLSDADQTVTFADVPENGNRGGGTITSNGSRTGLDRYLAVAGAAAACAVCAGIVARKRKKAAEAEQ